MLVGTFTPPKFSNVVGLGYYLLPLKQKRNMQGDPTRFQSRVGIEPSLCYFPGTVHNSMRLVIKNIINMIYDRV